MSTLVRSSVAVLLLLILAVPVASANQEWCTDDPPRALLTPHGNVVLVFVTLGAHGDQYLPDLTQGLVNTTSSAQSATRGGVAGTLFTLTVHIPSDLLLGGFATQGITSSGALGTGTIYATSTGASGAPLVMAFWYPLP